MVAILLQNEDQVVLFFKNVLALIMRFFWQKIHEIWTLEKLETMMKKDCFLEKKRFLFLRSLLYENGKAQNISVVAGRLVASIVQTLLRSPKLLN